MAAEQFDPCLAANVFKDPHLSFAYGGTADLRGRHNALYNFLSTPRLSVNVRTEEALFQLHDGMPPCRTGPSASPPTTSTIVSRGRRTGST